MTVPISSRNLLMNSLTIPNGDEASLLQPHHGDGHFLQGVTQFSVGELSVHTGLRSDDGDFAAEIFGHETAAGRSEEVEANFAVLLDFDQGTGTDLVVEIVRRRIKASKFPQRFFGEAELLRLGLGQIGCFDRAGIVFSFRFCFSATGTFLAVSKGRFQNGNLLGEFFDQLGVDICFGHAASIDKWKGAD